MQAAKKSVVAQVVEENEAKVRNRGKKGLAGCGVGVGQGLDSQGDVVMI